MRVRTTLWFGLKYLFLVENSCEKYPSFGCNKMGNCPEFLLKNIRWCRADKRRKAVGPRQKISCNFTRKELGRVWDTTCQHYVLVTWTIVPGNLMQTFEKVFLLHNIGYYFGALNYTLCCCHASKVSPSLLRRHKSLEEDKFNPSVVSNRQHNRGNQRTASWKPFIYWLTPRNTLFFSTRTNIREEEVVSESSSISRPSWFDFELQSENKQITLRISIWLRSTRSIWLRNRLQQCLFSLSAHKRVIEDFLFWRYETMFRIKVSSLGHSAVCVEIIKILTWWPVPFSHRLDHKALITHVLYVLWTDLTLKDVCGDVVDAFLANFPIKSFHKMVQQVVRGRVSESDNDAAVSC